MPASPQRLNLQLGLLLLAVWLAATAAVVVLHLAIFMIKVVLGVCALIWAIHVAQVLLANRKP